jgi:hypothetical protein
MRLRDTAVADRLVTIASDPAPNRQLRRATIFAAGRLRYEAALEKIVSVIMAERSPLTTIDGNSSFCCHAVMSSILLCGADGMASIFARGRAGFVKFFEGVFEASWKEASPEGLPSGAEAAGWLFDRLVHHRWPTKREAPDFVLNELNIPMLQSAVLRSLRLAGRPDLIDEQLSHADHVWFAMKCLMERSRAGRGDPDLAPHLTGLVAASPCKGNARLHRVIAERIGGSRTMPLPTGQAAGQAEAEPPVSYITYEDIVRVLSGADADFKSASAFVMAPVTAEQAEAKSV